MPVFLWPAGSVRVHRVVLTKCSLKMADALSTPVNTISRDNLTVLITNNILNNSVEFSSDCDTMETDSPIRKPNTQIVNKKLFHSPLAENPNEVAFIRTNTERSRRAKKRKQILIPETTERIQEAYLRECDKDTYSPDAYGGMRKKVLISLFHNKEYSMDLS